MALDLVIIGAGGHGREALDVVEAINRNSPLWTFLGFLDDAAAAPDRLERRNAVILAPIMKLETLDSRYVIGIGDCGIRADIDARSTSWGRQAVTLIHPHATVASDNRLADGVLLAAGSRVTTNVSLGRHVHLNVNAVVSHDCNVGAYSTLSPGVHLNGEVGVGERVFFGTGAIVTPGVSIGADAVIGAGAVVVHDVPAGSTVKGVPGRW